MISKDSNDKKKFQLVPNTCLAQFAKKKLVQCLWLFDVSVDDEAGDYGSYHGSPGGSPHKSVLITSPSGPRSGQAGGQGHIT